VAKRCHCPGNCAPKLFRGRPWRCWFTPILAIPGQGGIQLGPDAPPPAPEARFLARVTLRWKLSGSALSRSRRQRTGQFGEARNPSALDRDEGDDLEFRILAAHRLRLHDVHCGDGRVFYDQRLERHASRGQRLFLRAGLAEEFSVVRPDAVDLLDASLGIVAGETFNRLTRVEKIRERRIEQSAPRL